MFVFTDDPPLGSTDTIGLRDRVTDGRRSTDTIGLRGRVADSRRVDRLRHRSIRFSKRTARLPVRDAEHLADQVRAANGRNR